MSVRLRQALPSRLRIGLSVGERSVRAVGVRGTTVLWAFEGDLEEGESLAAAIGNLLALAPLARWPKPVLTAAVGPSRAQVKQLADLPAVKDRRALSALVQEGANRFFLRNGVPLVTSAVVPSGSRAPWVAAFDRPVIDDIAAACTAAGVRFQGAIPSAAVVGPVLGRDCVTWRDGDTIAEISYAGGAIAGLRRRRAELASGGCRAGSEPAVSTPASGEVAEAEPDGPLATLAPGAARYADAYGAAITALDTSLAYRAKDSSAFAAPVPRWRLGLAAAAFALAVIASLATPVARDLLVARAAAARLTALGDARLEAARLERELAQVTAALAVVTSFELGRHSTLTVLEAFADSLPDATALVTLRLDSLDGTAVLLGPRVASAVSALDRSGALTGVEIVGPVTREALGGRELERASVRFRRVGRERGSAERVTIARRGSP